MIHKPFFKFVHLVTASTFATIALAIATMPPPPNIDAYEQEIREQRVTIEETTALYHDTLAQLKLYETSEEDLVAIGASSEQAQAIISSSKLYHISPKH